MVSPIISPHLLYDDDEHVDDILDKGLATKSLNTCSRRIRDQIE